MQPRRTSIGLLSLVAFAAACSAEAPAARAPDEPPVAAPEARVAPSAMPAVVDDVATLVPLGAIGVVELPDVSKIVASLTAAQRGVAALARPAAEREVAEKLGISADLVRDVGDAFEGAVGFTDGKDFAVVARFSEGASIKQALGGLDPQVAANAPGRAVFRSKGAPNAVIAWYERPRVLVFATSAGLAARVERVAEHAEKSFADSPRRLPREPLALHVYGDLGALAAGQQEAVGLVDAGSSARASVSCDVADLRSRLELALVGERLPRLATVLAPHVPTLAARLPEETVLFATIGLERKPGRALRDVVAEVLRPAGGGLDARLDTEAKATIGLGLAELDGLVGGELTLGVAATPNARLTLDKPNDLARDAAFYAVIETRDEARARKILAVILREAKKRPASDGYKIASSATSIRWTPVRPLAPPISLALHRGALVLAAGAPKLVDRFTASFDRKERTLGASAGYASTSSVLAQGAEGFLWMDLDRLGGALGPTFPKSGKIGTSRAVLGGGDRGLELVIDGREGADIAIVGTVAALGIYGVQRYLAASKVAEARSNIDSIARAAVSSFERELPGPSGAAVPHKLCKTAQAVPRHVPSGTKYVPSTAAGQDFDSGTNEVGWRCLRFALTTPHHYQYEYRQGGSYKGPKRGGPDAGPDGFEISAEGDLDGNGRTSLLTRIGRVRNGRVVLSPQLFVVDELE